jgi:hypothetical protein
MTTDDLTALDEWQRKGATLSDKAAQKELEPRPNERSGRRL